MVVEAALDWVVASSEEIAVDTGAASAVGTDEEVVAAFSEEGAVEGVEGKELEEVDVSSTDSLGEHSGAAVEKPAAAVDEASSAARAPVGTVGEESELMEAGVREEERVVGDADVATEEGESSVSPRREGYLSTLSEY